MTQSNVMYTTTNLLNDEYLSRYSEVFISHDNDIILNNEEKKCHLLINETSLPAYIYYNILYYVSCLLTFICICYYHLQALFLLCITKLTKKIVQYQLISGVLFFLIFLILYLMTSLIFDTNVVVVVSKHYKTLFLPPPSHPVIKTSSYLPNQRLDTYFKNLTPINSFFNLPNPSWFDALIKSIFQTNISVQTIHTSSPIPSNIERKKHLRNSLNNNEALNHTCNQLTGGTCQIQQCYEWRKGSQCMNGICVCPPGYCSDDGMCQGCTHIQLIIQDLTQQSYLSGTYVAVSNFMIGERPVWKQLQHPIWLWFCLNVKRWVCSDVEPNPILCEGNLISSDAENSLSPVNITGPWKYWDWNEWREDTDQTHILFSCKDNLAYKKPFKTTTGIILPHQ